MVNRFLFGGDRPLSDAKENAEASREALDKTIDQVHDMSTKVIAQARKEISHSERIIAVAEQAIRSLKTVERQQ